MMKPWGKYEKLVIEKVNHILNNCTVHEELDELEEFELKELIYNTFMAGVLYSERD